jgi:hypothetical protein
MVVGYTNTFHLKKYNWLNKCYWHEESQSMRSNNEQKMWDNLMTWDTEFQVQIETMENMENMEAALQGDVAQNLLDSVDYMYFMDRHASAVSNNPRSIDASTKPPTSIT